jgi:hypothetical protein
MHDSFGLGTDKSIPDSQISGRDQAAFRVFGMEGGGVKRRQ